MRVVMMVMVMMLVFIVVVVMVLMSFIRRMVRVFMTLRAVLFQQQGVHLIDNSVEVEAANAKHIVSVYLGVLSRLHRG
jgi:hypothetical protein